MDTNNYKPSNMAMNIIAVVLTGITALLLWHAHNVMAHDTSLNEAKYYTNEPAPLKINRIDKYTMRMAVPVVNDKTREGADAVRYLPVICLIQQILEDSLKANNGIALMAVYSNDGTILAHYKPERIGRNMFDVDVELGDSRQEIYKAIKNRKICVGLKYDPVDNIRFIVKPLKIGNLDHNLSLFIGFSESYVLRETGSSVIITSTAGTEGK